ncbi:MAG: hypothetical protein EZS28_053322, partial [Streblomastix strix]
HELTVSDEDVLTFMKQSPMIDFLFAALRFVGLIEKRAFPLVSQMLLSSMNSDVLAAIQLATVAHRFQFQGFHKQCGLPLASLVWSGDPMVREACLGHFREVLGLPAVYVRRKDALLANYGFELEQNRERDRERERQNFQRDPIVVASGIVEVCRNVDQNLATAMEAVLQCLAR